MNYFFTIFKKFILGILVVFCFNFGMCGVATVHAQVSTEAENQLNAAGGTRGAGLTATDPRVIIGRIVRVLLSLVGIILFCFLFYAGFLWLTAAGNEDQVERAKEIIKTTIIGLFVVLVSLSITQYVLFYAQYATTGTTPGPATPPVYR